MRFDRLRLATKLWLAMVAMVLIMALILGYSALQSRQYRAAFATANTAMLARIKTANQWAALSEVNATRSYAVVVSIDPGVVNAFKTEISDSLARIAELQKNLESMGLSEQDTAQLAKIAGLRQKVQELSGQTALLKVTGKPGELTSFMEAQYRPAVLAVQKAHQEFVDSQERANDALRADFDAQSGQLALASAVGLMALVAAIFAGAAFLIRAIKQPLLQANGLASRIAQGDLSADVDESRADEFGDLMRSLAAMNRSLGAMVSQVRSSTDSIATASAEIATGNNDLAQRTEQTSSNLQTTASSMGSLTQAVQQSADNARQASTLADSASSVAERGGSVVTEVITTMQEIDASSKKIADIIGVIDGIAFQTNILALNAAVEAARAGEQGRGFAVVASEVRSLAQRSAEAAKEIKGLIGTSVSKVESGTRLVSDAGSTMQEIVQSVRRVVEVISAITAASSEQSTGIAEVNQAIGQLDQMTQQNAALVEESAAAAESLREQADRMKQAVAVFKVASGGHGTSSRALSLA
ncbi:methyl-accepting chemotaxis protein [Rhodoferax saidenbachensis]|uniref:Methyl-accepting chemotaxis protein n=1 Tax=Rhodoferax saidenbachensis TaxID=1484693 RepID=A0A1P8KBJ5_9BURK|nr:methyl-accepting chemotaxis protein [Rhodoferax saidenbachensis]APW43371.1 methyl-accepting chemotaxis protein [Rhodoferax saidenbachensis]